MIATRIDVILNVILQINHKMKEPRTLGVVPADGYGNLTFSETLDGLYRFVQAAAVSPRPNPQSGTTRANPAA